MYKLPLLLLEAAVQQLSSLYWELSRFSPKSLLRDLERPDIRKKNHRLKLSNAPCAN